MPSQTRLFIQSVMKDLAARYTKDTMDVLDIGTAGNLKGENDEWFGSRAKSYKTLDKLKELNPDIVCDISSNLSKEQYQEYEGKFDIIIISQVIEHIDPTKTELALRNCHYMMRDGGVIILDSPGRVVEYHPEPGFDHYGWYTATGLGRILSSAGFKIIGEETKMNDLLSLVVGRK